MKINIANAPKSNQIYQLPDDKNKIEALIAISGITSEIINSVCKTNYPGKLNQESK